MWHYIRLCDIIIFIISQYYTTYIVYTYCRCKVYVIVNSVWMLRECYTTCPCWHLIIVWLNSHPLTSILCECIYFCYRVILNGQVFFFICIYTLFKLDRSSRGNFIEILRTGLIIYITYSLGFLVCEYTTLIYCCHYLLKLFGLGLRSLFRDSFGP